MSLCRCPLDPLLGLLSAHDEHPDQWSSLVLRDILVISTREFGLEAKLGDPGDQWPAWVSDMILRPAKWKAMLARARTEDWWNDLSDGLDEDTLECGIHHRTVHLPRVQQDLQERTKSSCDTQDATHGHRKPVSNYIASDCLECTGCNKHFPSKSKLLDHAQYRSKGCRDKILLSQS